MKTLLGITGLADAGKDSFAKAFIGAGYTPLAFADALKKVTAYVAGEDVALYHSREHKELHSDNLGMARRTALQNVGLGMREAISPMVWIRRVMITLDQLGWPPAIITDVRFDNEAEIIREQGGIIVRVTRPGNVGLTGAQAAHASERGVRDDLVDIDVVNNGTLGELRWESLKVMQYLEGRQVDPNRVISALAAPGGFVPGHLGMDL